ncbi:MAG: 2Fe-2S iron-sulfur cluster-binding protein, partial [Microvirga sp.]
DDPTIRHELEGNLCRCTGYHNIVKAIAAGAKAMEKGSTTSAAQAGEKGSAPGLFGVGYGASISKRHTYGPVLDDRQRQGSQRTR